MSSKASSMYMPVLPSNPCMCTCQPSYVDNKVSHFTSPVWACTYRSVPVSTSCVYKRTCMSTSASTQVDILRIQAVWSMHIYKSKASMDIYVHLSTCAFNPSANACAYMSIVNAGPIPSAWCWQYITWPVSVTQVNILCAHRPLSTHIYNKVCMSTKASCTYMSALPSILACVYMSIVNSSPMRCT